MKIIEKNDDFKIQSMHNENTGNTVNQLGFYLGAVCAKTTMDGN